ncbi:MAG: hypothetical protein QXZ70_07275 [Candidatus Bathyarchaeia archaeon]
MVEKTIRFIAPVSLALMMGIISAILALIIGILYAGVFSALISTIGQRASIALPWGAFSGIIAVLIPVFAAVGGFTVGFIHGLIIAALYNFLAPRIGGIKVHVE